MVAELAGLAIDAVAAGDGALVGGVVSMVGPSSPVTGIVVGASGFPWDNVPFLDLIRAAGVPQSLPLQLGNDANLAALAEYRALPEPRPQTLVHIRGGLGVGGGIVSDGAIDLALEAFYQDPTIVPGVG